MTEKQPEHRYPYIYTSSELGKYFGITIKGIEYYEKKGLIKPNRVGNNKQRQFNLMETYRIWMTRYLRQIGFNVDQTLNVLNAEKPVAAEDAFAAMIAKLKRQQLRLNTTIEVLEHNLALLKKVDDGPFFEVTDSPDFKWLFLRSMEGAHRSDAHQSDEYRQWNELMPITDASVRYGHTAVVSDEKDLEPEIGMIMTSAHFDKFGLSSSTRVQSIPGQKCLHTVLVGDSQQIESRQWLQPALDELRRRHLNLQGDVLTSVLLVLDNDETHVRFDEAWLPVE